MFNTLLQPLKDLANREGVESGSIRSRLFRAFLPLTLIILVANVLFVGMVSWNYHFQLPYIIVFAGVMLIAAALVNLFVVNEISRSMGSMMDEAIAANRTVQEKLLTQKLFYENILNKIPVDVAVYDRNFRYIYCNPSTIQDPTERQWLIGRTDADYVALKKLDPRISEERKALFESALKRKFAISVEQNYTNERGEEKYTLRTILPSTDAPNPDTFISFGLDITSLKQHEEILRSKNAELEKINFELDRFVYSASHDLKAPLSSVLGLISLARTEMRPEDQHAYYDMMERSIRKLDKFINDLIHFSRNTRLEIASEPVDFETIITDRVEDLRYMEDAHKVRLERSIDKAAFWSDERRISTIFNNILSNAVKYHNPVAMDPWVKISIEVDEQRAIIVVQDNGIGIEGHHVDHIFNMFYRATELSKGSGLGLYIVKEIISKLKGSVMVESVAGEGTTIKIILPNQAPPQATKPLVAEQAKLAATA